jgi:hypothetical protein
MEANYAVKKLDMSHEARQKHEGLKANAGAGICLRCFGVSGVIRG